MPLANWEFGVLASLLASLCGTLGGQLRICSLTCAERVARLLQVCGWSFWLTGQGLGQVAILLAPATVAACVTFSGSLLCNALLAPLVLHEHLTRMHGVGIGLLSAGGTAVTWASCRAGEDYNWAQLCELVQQPHSLGMGAGCLCVAFAFMAYAWRCGEMDVCSFAYLFALCGAMDLLVTKFTLQLLRLRVMESDPDLVPSGVAATVFVVLMIFMHTCTFGFQVVSVYYRRALQSLPLFLGSGAIMQISLCGVFFNEFNFTVPQAVAFLTGLCFVLVGLLVTSRAAPKEDAGSKLLEDEGVPDLVWRPPTAGNRMDISPPDRLSLQRIVTSSAASFPPFANASELRRTVSLSSADILFMGEIQRSALCFGGIKGPPQSALVFKRFETMPTFRRPLLVTRSHPGSPTQPVVPEWSVAASAPALVVS